MSQVGDIVELTIKYDSNSQQCMMINHFRVITPSALAVGGPEETEFMTSQQNQVGQTIYKRLRQVLAADVILQGMRCQIIRPTRIVSVDFDTVENGLRNGAAQTANIGACVTLKGLEATRSNIANLHIGGLSIDAYVDGKLKAADLVQYNLLGAQFLQVFSADAGGGQYRPVILHPKTAVPQHTDVFVADAKDTIRIMRRRTVGLGI